MKNQISPKVFEEHYHDFRLKLREAERSNEEYIFILVTFACLEKSIKDEWSFQMTCVIYENGLMCGFPVCDEILLLLCKKARGLPELMYVLSRYEILRYEDACIDLREKIKQACQSVSEIMLCSSQYLLRGNQNIINFVTEYIRELMLAESELK